MAIECSELRLVWPPALFAAEARALLATGADDDALGGLLVEAFHGDRAEQLLLQVARANPPRRPDHVTPGPGGMMIEIWEGGDPGMRATAQLVSELADDAYTLPRYVPRLLFTQRQRVVEQRMMSAPGGCSSVRVARSTYSTEAGCTLIERASAKPRSTSGRIMNRLLPQRRFISRVSSSRGPRAKLPSYRHQSLLTSPVTKTTSKPRCAASVSTCSQTR